MLGYEGKLVPVVSKKNNIYNNVLFETKWDKMIHTVTHE